MIGIINICQLLKDIMHCRTACVCWLIVPRRSTVVRNFLHKYGFSDVNRPVWLGQVYFWHNIRVHGTHVCLQLMRVISIAHRFVFLHATCIEYNIIVCFHIYIYMYINMYTYIYIIYMCIYIYRYVRVLVYILHWLVYAHMCNYKVHHCKLGNGIRMIRCQGIIAEIHSSSREPIHFKSYDNDFPAAVGGHIPQKGAL